MRVTFLVLTFLLGLMVLVFWLGSLPFLVPYTGLLVLLTWVILGSPFWSFLSFSSNGLDTDCLMKRLLDLILGLVVLFYFLLFLCQRELKYDMVVSLLVA